ncbi:MAG: DUF4175 family protein [Endomicrobiales bacterium]
MKNTARFIRTLRRRILLSSLAGRALEWITLCLALAAAFSLADHVLHFPPGSLKIPVLLALAAAVFFFSRFFLLNRGGRLSDENLIILAQKALPRPGDELLSAWQLSKDMPEGVSKEMARALSEKMEGAAGALRAHAVCPFIPPKTKALARIAAGLLLADLLLFAVPPHILRASLARIAFALSSSAWNSYFSVNPGDAEYSIGSKAEITVKEKQPLRGEPALWLRPEGGPWRNERLFTRGTGSYGFTVEQLSAGIEYRVRWGDLESRRFRLTPVLYPQLGDFTVRYEYPAYTGIAPQEVKGSPSLSALAGTRVTVTARSSKKLKSASLLKTWEGEASAGVNRDLVTVRFTVSTDGSYRIRAQAEDGTTDPDPPEFAVRAGKDEPPRVDLLSPAEDLVIPSDSEIPLVGEARDDFGLTRVELRYKRGDRKEERVTVLSLPQGTGQKSFEYLWKTANLNAKPGEKITYCLEAWDNDTHSGPKSSVTPLRFLEITDYEREHEKIEEELRHLKESLLNVLADQTGAREKARALEAQFSTPTCHAALREQQQVRAGLQKPADTLKNLLLRMENDPLTDFSTFTEYRGLATCLEQLRDGPAAEALAALGNREFARAGREQDEIIAALEKLSLLSGDLWQYQRMRDVMDRSAELRNASRRLSERLGEGAPPGELRDALEHISGLLEKIQRQLSQFPQELPEDFVNSPAVKEINMSSYQDLASRLREAIERGDWEKARSLASSFTQDLESLLQTLETAGKDTGFASASGERLKNEIARYGMELEKIRKRQEEVTAENEQMEGLRRQNLFRAQETHLDGLFNKQKLLIERAQQLKGRAAPLLPPYAGSLDPSLVLMRKVLDEFSRKRVYHSQKYLEDVMALLAGGDRIVANDSSGLDAETRQSFRGEAGALIAGEKEILDFLKKEPDNSFFSPSQEEELRSMARKEDGLSDETRRFRRMAEEFGRQSTALDQKTFRSLEQAAVEMRSAADDLRGSRSTEALEHGQKALEHLTQAQKGVSSAMEAMGERGQKAGKPVASPLQMRSGGGTGFRSAPVKLPRINEYKPPREFRQEIMDALKEKYPPQYEKLIREYYRRLTE